MSMILPIVSLASLAGMAFVKSRPDSNGKHPDPARIPLDDLPRIRAALEAEDPSVQVLAAAIQEARAVGFHGAAAMFEDRIKLIEARQAGPLPGEAEAAAVVDQAVAGVVAETDYELVERTIREAVEDVLGPDDAAVDPFDLPFDDDGVPRPSVSGDFLSSGSADELLGGEPDGRDFAPAPAAKKNGGKKNGGKKNGGKKSRRTAGKKKSGSGSGSVSGAKS